MALIQILTDANNDVVGAREVEDTNGRQALATTLQAYRQTRDMGLQRFIELETAKSKIDLSSRLTDEQKTVIKTIITGAQVGDRVVFVSATEAELMAGNPPALGDSPGGARPIVQVFYDP